MLMLYAKASTTEEPDAGKPHVRVCAGGALGNWRSYREMCPVKIESYD
ncbi:MAG: hypothetical protein LWX52_10815 [Deltaproteobacteria bacterium]|jgi:hypothetical protein|nr:hypothetical protein [Deltaproteobacteria bacterium]